MNLRGVEKIDKDLNVVLRIDSDLPIEEGKILDNSRLVKSVSTINLLLEKNCKLIILGYRGRPDGIDPNLSLRSVYAELMSLLRNGNEEFDVSNVFVDDVLNSEKIKDALRNNQIVFLENLRFWPGENNNDAEFLSSLSFICQAFVNDSIATAHRKTASVMLHKNMETYYGLNFVEEVEKIEMLLKNPKRPLLIILGGIKKDKLKYLEKLADMADKVLLGGKLPDFVDEVFLDGFVNKKNNIVVGKLDVSGRDINNETIEKFKEMINSAGTVVWAGSMGKYENEENRKGTEEIARAVAKSVAYKIIAGGDTKASLAGLELTGRMDFVCSGGGALLEFLTNGTLPAWE
ncbi:phosphoglycerate kinase [Patescibacteria group bacterium]|nr:phosphoglycerate kinase [Patescibacteria group bacterium]